MNKSIQIISILIIFVLASCNSIQDKSSNTVADTSTIKGLTMKWNECLVRQDINTLNSLYAEQVSLYGTSISKFQAIKNKEDFFEKHPDYNQSITGDITVIKVTENQFKAIFPKRSSFNGKTNDVEGYLLFDRIDKDWKITKESDELTDKNVSKQFSNKEIKELNTCIDVVMEILTTSPVYINRTKGLYEAIVKNGGTSFGIMVEGSPNPSTDKAMGYSETYDFSLHETYSDRMVTIARFTFDPVDRQLYEYDILEDDLIPVDFDRNLLLKFNEICK